MSSPLKLEVFEILQDPEGPVVLMPDDVEDIRLNAYERGYVAGWDDCANQNSDDQADRRAAVERQIEQLGFTYHEARGHMLKSIEPLLEAILETLLPAAIRCATIPQVLEQLMPLAHASTDTPLQLNVAMGQKSAFLSAFEGQILPPLEIVENADLAEGTASFSIGGMQTRIDLSGVSQALEASVRKFYQLSEEEIQIA